MLRCTINVKTLLRRTIQAEGPHPEGGCGHTASEANIIQKLPTIVSQGFGRKADLQHRMSPRDASAERMVTSVKLIR
jgi:hypothetical protein